MILLELWRRRDIVLVLIVVGVVYVAKLQYDKIKILQVQIAEKPAVVDRVVMKTVQGPERVVEKIVEKPGGERVIERTVYKEAVTAVATNDHSEIPICPAPERKNRYLFGASADPFRAQDGQMLHAGYSINNRIDLSYGHSVNGPDRNDIRVVLRF